MTTTQAAAMVLREREACAKVCDDSPPHFEPCDCAEAILNRKD